MAFSTDNIGKNCYINMSEDENVEDSLYGTIIGYYKDTDKNEEYYFVSINGNVKRIYDDSLIEIIEGGGSGAVSSVNGKTGAVILNAEDVGGAQESLKLTAMPTDGPDGETTLMSGTWSGATWQQVVTAIQNSRLIQVDVTNIGKITLLYNLGSATNASSNAFVYGVGGTLYNVFVELLIAGSINRFYLTIINARTETENVPGTTPTIIPADNTIYKCGELTSLTISNPPATGKYSIIFFSGATPTTTVGIANFTAEANKRYKIKVEDNYATYDSWPYTPT